MDLIRSEHRAGYPTGLVALFIDWDNFAIGLREEMPGQPANPGPMLRWARRFGTLVVCRAYGEWRDPAERLAVYNAGVETIYAPVLPLSMSGPRSNGGGKSLADTAMAVDCVDVIHLVPGLSTLIVASSDKDLIPILRFAQRRGLRVFVLGSDRTATALRDMADDYVTYRTLLEINQPAPVAPLPAPLSRRVHVRGEARQAPAVRPGVSLGPVPPARVSPSPLVSASPTAEPRILLDAISSEEAGTDGALTTSARRRRRGGRRRRTGQEVIETAAAKLVHVHDDALTPSVEEAHAALQQELEHAAEAADGAVAEQAAQPDLLVSVPAVGVKAEVDSAVLQGEGDQVAVDVATPSPVSAPDFEPSAASGERESAATVAELPVVEPTRHVPVVLPGERLSRMRRQKPDGAAGTDVLTLVVAEAVAPPSPSMGPSTAGLAAHAEAETTPSEEKTGGGGSIAESLMSSELEVDAAPAGSARPIGEPAAGTATGATLPETGTQERQRTRRPSRKKSESAGGAQGSRGGEAPVALERATSSEAAAGDATQSEVSAQRPASPRGRRRAGSRSR